MEPVGEGEPSEFGVPWIEGPDAHGSVGCTRCGPCTVDRDRWRKHDLCLVSLEHEVGRVGLSVPHDNRLTFGTPYVERSVSAEGPCNTTRRRCERADDLERFGIDQRWWLRGDEGITRGCDPDRYRWRVERPQGLARRDGDDLRAIRVGQQRGLATGEDRPHEEVFGDVVLANDVTRRDVDEPDLLERRRGGVCGERTRVATRSCTAVVLDRRVGHQQHGFADVDPLGSLGVQHGATWALDHIDEVARDRIPHVEALETRFRWEVGDVEFGVRPRHPVHGSGEVLPAEGELGTLNMETTEPRQFCRPQADRGVRGDVPHLDGVLLAGDREQAAVGIDRGDRRPEQWLVPREAEHGAMVPQGCPDGLDRLERGAFRPDRVEREHQCQLGIVLHGQHRTCHQLARPCLGRSGRGIVGRSETPQGKDDGDHSNGTEAGEHGAAAPPPPLDGQCAGFPRGFEVPQLLVRQRQFRVTRPGEMLVEACTRQQVRIVAVMSDPLTNRVL